MSGWKLCPQNSFRLSHPALKVSLNYVLSSFTVFTQNFNMITQTDISPSDRWIITQQIIKWVYSKWDTINVSHTLTAFFFTDRCRDFFYLFRCYSHRCHGTDCLCTCLATRGSWSISDVTWCLALLLWESNHQLQHFLRCVCVSVCLSHVWCHFLKNCSVVNRPDAQLPWTILGGGCIWVSWGRRSEYVRVFPVCDSTVVLTSWGRVWLQGE